ncbi:hypothetical protein [uncultured Hyphomonas sp.]|uniref:hypothetical protein n=1 Tax=uncultured Hyphomonas sp. TaxID=225298 RepID=UPI002AAB9009|nr:hypothetical protein [uncultured Hyphomonas sp.]
MRTLHIPDPPAPVFDVYETYPRKARGQLLLVRTILYETAHSLPGAGRITETLKWGEPAYLTERPKSGTTIRLAWSPRRPDSAGIFVNCQTTLLDEWRALYGETLDLVGNREIRLPLGQTLPAEPVRHCLAMALTYHQRKPAQ